MKTEVTLHWVEVMRLLQNDVVETEDTKITIAPTMIGTHLFRGLMGDPDVEAAKMLGCSVEEWKAFTKRKE